MVLSFKCFQEFKLWCLLNPLSGNATCFIKEGLCRLTHFLWRIGISLPKHGKYDSVFKGYANTMVTSGQ